MTFEQYELFAPLFIYPAEDLPLRVAELRAVLDAHYPTAAAELARFAAHLPDGSSPLCEGDLDEMQEVFTRSFEVQSIATLDIGYVAFGDDYKRGELLVNLSRELRDVGVDPGIELADHLSNVLRLLGRWQNLEAMTELVTMVLHPCLEKMVREFGEERMESRNALYRKHYKTVIDSVPRRGSMYQHALVGLLEMVRADFDLTDTARPEKTSDFLASLRNEFELEARGEGQRPAGRTP